MRASKGHVIVARSEQRSPGTFVEFLELYDASDIERGPAGSIEVGGRVKAADARGDWLFVLNGDDDLRVLDISNPSSMREHGTLEFERGTTLAPTIEVVGRSDGIAFVLLDDRLEIVDARADEAIRSVGRLENLIRPRGLWLSDDERHLFILDLVWREPMVVDAHIAVFDLRDAQTPRRIGAAVMPDIYAPETGLTDDFGPLLTAQDGDMLIVGARRLAAFDVSEPASPKLVANTRMPVRAGGVVAGGGTVFVVEGGSIVSYRLRLSHELILDHRNYLPSISPD